MHRLLDRRRRDAEEVVFELVREHAYELLRFARRFSLCDDDAQDAYQRSLEILVRHVRGERPPRDTLPWLRTVLRREAYRVREERERRLTREPYDVERERASADEDPAERVERIERLEVTAQALRRLKPQEVTALVLRAEGLSYREICDRTSWTYTRCNRCVTEGRRALRERMREIESGEECERWLPLLSLLADGEASARDLAELRPHLRACTACRATLRSFHAAPRQVSALVPVAVLPVAASVGQVGLGGVLRHAETLLQSALERVATSAVRAQAAVEAVSGAKVAAVAASTVAVASGGAAIEHAASESAVRAGRAQARAHVVHATESAAPAVAASATGVLGGATATVLGTGRRLGAMRGDRGAGSSVGAEFGIEPGVPAPGAAGGGGRESAEWGRPVADASLAAHAPVPGVTAVDSDARGRVVAGNARAGSVTPPEFDRTTLTSAGASSSGASSAGADGTAPPAASHAAAPTSQPRRPTTPPSEFGGF